MHANKVPKVILRGLIFEIKTLVWNPTKKDLYTVNTYESSFDFCFIMV